MNQSLLVKDTVHKGIKEIYNLSDNMIEILKKEEGIREDYFSKKKKLEQKKENLWLVKDIEKWEINQNEDTDMTKIYEDKDYAFEKMCYKENEVINNLKGFISSLKKFGPLNDSKTIDTISEKAENSIDYIIRESKEKNEEIIKFISEKMDI